MKWIFLTGGVATSALVSSSTEVAANPPTLSRGSVYPESAVPPSTGGQSPRSPGTVVFKSPGHSQQSDINYLFQLSIAQNKQIAALLQQTQTLQSQLTRMQSNLQAFQTQYANHKHTVSVFHESKPCEGINTFKVGTSKGDQWVALPYIERCDHGAEGFPAYTEYIQSGPPK